MTTAVDVWALGCVWLELARERRPFESDFDTLKHFAKLDMEFIELTCEEPFSSEHDALIVHVVREMTRKQPAGRPSAEQVGQLCQSAISGSLNCAAPQHSIETNDASVQTDTLLVCKRAISPTEQKSDAKWKVCNAIVCPTNPYILTGSWNQDSETYKVQLRSLDLGMEEPLFERTQKVLDYPLAVIPGFSPNGHHFVVYSNANHLEIVRLENLKSCSFNPKPRSPTAVCAISVDNSGKRITYLYRESPFGHSPPKFDMKVEGTEVEDVKVAAIATTLSDVSITYDSHGEYLFSVGKERFEVRVLVWDLPKRCLRRSFTLSAGEFRDFPAQSLSLCKPFFAIISSHPNPRDNVPTYLRIYTQKGNEVYKFGSQQMIFTSLDKMMLILTMGNLFYLDPDDRYEDPPEWLCDDEIELKEKWFFVDNSLSRFGNYQNKFFIWSWNGSERKAKCLGHLTSKNLPHYDDVVAFTLQNETIIFILEGGDVFTSQVSLQHPLQS